MADHHDIQELVEQTVAELFAAHIPELRHELGEKVMEAIAPKLAEMAEQAAQAQASAKSSPETAAGGGPTDLLNAAVASLYDVTAQTEILRTLLDGLSQFTARAVLFVMKAGNLSAWQSRGFADEGSIKGLSMSGTEGLAGRAIADKEPVSAAAVEFSSAFIETHGNPHDGNASVHPLIVRDKVAAVIYTDAGPDPSGKSDQSAVQLLVRSASSWLEIQALRKTAGAPSAEPAEAPAPPPPPEPAKAAPAAAPAAAKPAAAADSALAGLPPEEQEVHKKAKRFAKLLVDEIKLYNPAKVTEAKASKSIYAVMREDIDKSRATYDKRYAATASVIAAGYFSQELIRILADGDAANMGADFSH